MSTTVIFSDSSTTESRVISKGNLSSKRRQKLCSTILVAEDDADVRLMLRTRLEMKGYCVVEAGDGQEAIRVAQDEHPDIILMDLQLPRLNGFAVTRYVRQHEELRGVPIVILSGHDPAKHRNLALAAGCNEYLLKPVDFNRLEETITRLLPIAA
ncbi:MAG TPA: response regulator [Pyrinomonadaceae bacterium]|jgi:CheY-like chemotaxis protein|nr:response regulator [Pyrinomonadaceae bacterium]